ncbi:hypothetical protein CEQ90_00710 [Lewinellaceae bacterium SD302]|nr:hypothetical protein CEQ90_00710 [Lewinellaceae bacterium SD302]
MENKLKVQACPVLHTIDNEWLLKGQKDLKNTTLVNLNLDEISLNWEDFDVDASTLFIGCRIALEEELSLRKRGVNFLYAPNDLPYRPLRNVLYSYEELMEGYSPGKDNSVDLNIYRHFEYSRRCPSINEALWQRLHDFSIDEALRRLLHFQENGLTRRKSVGFMGGHSTGRDTDNYRRSVRTAKMLAEAGYFVVSGGGPGIMEAANLGAYLAGISEEELQWVFDTLAASPKYTDAGFHEAAYEVLERFPDGNESLAIPTWFYGHEPSNLFATYIAKYFSNSIREDTLLAISLYGIVYAPGSAGTTQEIFQEAAQNHYVTYDFVSPMVFLGRERYEIETSLYPTLRQLAFGRRYFDYLSITDEPGAVVEFLKSHPPVKAQG